MNPKASLKSLKIKVRPIASRPGVSDQPDNCASADFRASADSLSVMFASRFHTGITLTPEDTLWIPAGNKAAGVFFERSGYRFASRKRVKHESWAYAQARPMAARGGGKHDRDV